jgi:hypothetical protein
MRKFIALGPRRCGRKKHVTRRVAGDNLESPLSSLATITSRHSKTLCGNVILAEAQGKIPITSRTATENEFDRGGVILGSPARVTGAGRRHDEGCHFESAPCSENMDMEPCA